MDDLDGRWSEVDAGHGQPALRWFDQRLFARVTSSATFSFTAASMGLALGSPEITAFAPAVAATLTTLADALLAQDPDVVDRPVDEAVRAATGADEAQLAEGKALALRLLADPPTDGQWLEVVSDPDAAARRLTSRIDPPDEFDPDAQTVAEVADLTIQHTLRAVQTYLAAVLPLLLGMRRSLDDLQATVLEHDATLRDHDATLEEHSAALRLHDTALEEYGAALEKLQEDAAQVKDRLAHPLAHTARIEVGKPPEGSQVFQPRLEAQRKIDAAWGGPDTQTVVLTQVVLGDGGVGKSQLAREYFERSDAAVKVWGDASRLDNLVGTYAAAARRLGLPGENDEEQAEAFHTWLRETDGSWFVVLDDLALDPTTVAPWWPEGPAGRAMITTRRRDSSYSREGRSLVDLTVYTPDEAVSFVTRCLKTHNTTVGPADRIDPDPTQIANLTKNLGYHPVALSLAVAVIIDDPRFTTVDDYRLTFDDRSRALADALPGVNVPHAELFRRQHEDDDYQWTIATTWDISVTRAKEHSEHAPAMAALLSFAHPTQTPRCLFLTEAARHHLAFATNPDADVSLTSDEAWNALNALHRVSLITIGRRGWDPIGIHALAQRTISDSLTNDHRDDAARALADATMEVWPVERDPDITIRLCAVANNLSEVRYQALVTDGAPHPVLFRAGRSLGESGQVVKAVHYLERLVQQLTASVGTEHPDTLRTRHSLALFRGATGNPSRATTELGQLLADQQQALGYDHPDTLMTRQDLAHYHGMSGDPTRAIAEYERLLADRQRVLGPDHIHTLIARNNLARFRGMAGDLAEAVTEYRILLEDRLRILGPDHPHTLTTRHNLAQHIGLSGNSIEAVNEFERLLKDRRRVLGDTDFETLRTRHELAHWIGKAGDPARAVTEYEDLLEDRLRILGPDHPHTLLTRHNLARWRGEAGDPTRAVVEYESLLVDQLRVLEPEHRNTRETIRRLTEMRRGQIA